MKASINIEAGYRMSYMDKNLFLLGLEQLVNSGLKYIMGELKKGFDTQDFWKLRTTACSLKEIADYHGAPELAALCRTLQQHADKNEMAHIFPIYSQLATHVFSIRRALVHYLKLNRTSRARALMSRPTLPGAESRRGHPPC